MLWYDEYPERLEFELRALREAGFSYEVDAEKRAGGQLVLTVKCRISDVEHPLTVIFPANYPYFAFQVIAPTLSLAHHQDPYSKLLCFVAQIDSEWNAGTDTVAKYLLERLPEVLRANEDGTAVAEAREGAPVTGYMDFAAGSLVITADWSLPADKQRGRLLIGVEKGSNPNALLRCAILEVHDLDGNLLGEAAPTIKTRYPDRFNGRWVRLVGPPKFTGPLQVLAEATSVWSELKRPIFAGGPDVVGIVFQDEARFKEMHDLWVFVVRRRDREVAPRGGKRLPPGDQITYYLARPDRGGRDDIQTRIPRLKAMASKKASVFGLGALGSTVAWQLARAGIGRLNLIDHDFVQAGNIPRWMMGWTAAGFDKANVLASYIAQNYPFVEPIPISLKVGASMPLDTPQDTYEKLITQALEGTNLIIDCTVEFTVQHFLSDLAWKRGIPYIWATGTPGSWGGIVGRAIQGKTPGCWRCFRHNQSEGAYPSPSSEEGPTVQPVGCFSPTFTGSGFDMDSVALGAVRLAISTLCIDVENGYPDFDWDVGIVNLWSDGRPIAAHWETFPLEKHKACDAHV